MLVVSLNTITMAYTGDCNDTTSGASTHLRWLDSVLAATPSSVAVTIIGHVPPILFPPVRVASSVSCVRMCVCVPDASRVGMPRPVCGNESAL